MNRLPAWFLVLSLLLALNSGCQTTPKTQLKRSGLVDNAALAMAAAEAHDPTLKSFFKNAAGYAVFPNIVKAGFTAGAAYGKGVLYESGKLTGYCDITQASVGPQIGGQKYTELIFFETPAALEVFKKNKFSMNAQVTAVAVQSGAGINAKYYDNVVTFILDESGLMSEVSVGGQKFRYEPLD